MRAELLDRRQMREQTVTLPQLRQAVRDGKARWLATAQGLLALGFYAFLLFSSNPFEHLSLIQLLDFSTSNHSNNTPLHGLR